MAKITEELRNQKTYNLNGKDLDTMKNRLRQARQQLDVVRNKAGNSKKYELSQYDYNIVTSHLDHIERLLACVSAEMRVLGDDTLRTVLGANYTGAQGYNFDTGKFFVNGSATRALGLGVNPRWRCESEMIHFKSELEKQTRFADKEVAAVVFMGVSHYDYPGTFKLVEKPEYINRLQLARGNNYAGIVMTVVVRDRATGKFKALPNNWVGVDLTAAVDANKNSGLNQIMQYVNLPGAAKKIADIYTKSR